eukprot:COSAG01_NODE_1581_length_9827_cov_12.794613_5_plen_247_part_00
MLIGSCWQVDNGGARVDQREVDRAKPSEGRGREASSDCDLQYASSSAPSQQGRPWDGREAAGHSCSCRSSLRQQRRKGRGDRQLGSARASSTVGKCGHRQAGRAGITGSPTTPSNHSHTAAAARSPTRAARTAARRDRCSRTTNGSSAAASPMLASKASTAPAPGARSREKPRRSRSASCTIAARLQQMQVPALKEHPRRGQKGEAGKTPRRHQDDPGRHQAPPRRGGARDYSAPAGGHIAITAII